MKIGKTLLIVFFFNDTATTEIYTLSLHDALPISFHAPRAAPRRRRWPDRYPVSRPRARFRQRGNGRQPGRSEEHTSELQSRQYLVCRLLLEKKKSREPAQTARYVSRKLTDLTRSS